jgi:hypothetical protein
VFVRDPAVLPELALIGREQDRSKGAGQTHDKERDPGHYIDLTDDAKVMGIVPLDKLPVTREADDTALRAGGSPPDFAFSLCPNAVIRCRFQSD